MATPDGVNPPDGTDDQFQILKDFASSKDKQLLAKLEEILYDVAKSGQYIYPWHFMKPLYACKLEQVASEFLDSTPPLNTDGTEDEEESNNLKEFRDKLLVMFDKFSSAPFTIQRVSELLTNPKKHYKTTAKFFRGLEKNIHVVSTLEPVPLDLRPVLKRSFHDENPISQHNGYIDTELKPQFKKICVEEKNGDEVGSTESLIPCEEGETVEERSKVDAPNGGLENMLVCNELVTDKNQDGSEISEASIDTGITEVNVDTGISEAVIDPGISEDDADTGITDATTILGSLAGNAEIDMKSYEPVEDITLESTEES